MQLQNMYDRNSMEFIFIAVNNNSKHGSKLELFLSQGGTNYMVTVAKTKPLTWARQFEAFAVGGIKGMYLASLVSTVHSLMSLLARRCSSQPRT